MLQKESAPWLEKKFLDPQNLEAAICRIKQRGVTIALLNGSFDLMHAGHLYILHEASLQADLLLVALNSDESIRAYKHPSRPIISLEHRMEMLAAIEFVDYVTYFDETNPCALIEKVLPHVHVNGSEYGESCIEAKTLQRLNIPLHLVQRIPSLATSHLIKKIQQCV